MAGCAGAWWLATFFGWPTPASAQHVCEGASQQAWPGAVDGRCGFLAFFGRVGLTHRCIFGILICNCTVF